MGFEEGINAGISIGEAKAYKDLQANNFSFSKLAETIKKTQE